METDKGILKGYYCKILSARPFRPNFEVIVDSKDENERQHAEI